MINNSISSIDLGEVRDEQRIFWNSKLCCRKRKCCPGIILFVLVFQALQLLSVILIYAYSFYIAIEKETSSPFLKMVKVRGLLVSSPFYITYIAKICYGIAWFKKNRTRKAFLPYYRASMTSNISLILFCLMCANIFFASHKMYDGYIELSSALSYSLESIFLELYMRHIDKVHFARNDLLRD